MRFGSLRSATAFSQGIGSLFEVHVLESDKSYRRGMMPLKFFDIVLAKNLLLKTFTTPYKFEETASSCFHVGSGVVRLGKGYTKEERVQLGEGGQLITPPFSASYLTEVGSCLGTSIDYRHLCKRTLHPITVKLSPHNIDIKANILSHHILRLAERLVERFEHLSDRHALRFC